ncbi:MAG: hypothetical protein AUI49_07880 [Candidatus Rokubacteria bacterium 13_1_40CM_2_68_13]|nr:MAG: hypothetical protein AUI49_07880 [Candidatus Rokubacteria bacterium 13_1_40CM_2_68_13]
MVDDDTSLLRSLNRLLRAAGFTVETFESAEAFLQARRSSLPDCLVLDVHLGAVSGFDVHAQLVASGTPVPTIFITGHDDAYNLTQWKQQTRFGRASGATFSNPDFVELAHAFGAKGYHVTAARDLRPMLAEALAAAGPSIIDVPVDYRENARLTARLGQIVCPI